MEPITRKEMLMAKAAGQDVPDITPITREEYFLSQIANGGGGGGGGGFAYTPIVDDGHGGEYPEMTVNEIRAALEEGKMVVTTVVYDSGEHGKYYSYDFVVGVYFNDEDSRYYVSRAFGNGFSTSDPDSWGN